MRWYNTPHQLYCGIDWHARSMDVCLVHHEGARLLHRKMQAAPAPLLKAVAPYRAHVVVAVECLFTWYGRADLCAHEPIPCVLGHALSMQALHGGKATHDTSDSHKMAALLRGGLLPQASVSPAERRATRDCLRRRTPRLRQRAERLAHGQHTPRHDPLPALGKTSAYTANRAGVAERLHDPAVPKPLAVARALITADDQRRSHLARLLLTTATPHEAQTLSR